MRPRGLEHAQHVRGRDAIAPVGVLIDARRGRPRRALPLLALMLLALSLAPGAGPARAQEAAGAGSENGGYTQRGVPAEASAEDAVRAREQAYNSAQRIAYERMAAELGLPRGLSDGQIQRLVSSVVVEQERASRTGFSGRVTVNFNPGRVGRGRSPGGAPSGSPGGSPGGAPADSSVAAAAAPRPGPATGFVDAYVRYRSLPEWLDLRRRLAADPQVASLDVQAVAVDRARLRLGLRGPEEAAMAELARGGVAAERGADGAWRLGLGGGF